MKENIDILENKINRASELVCGKTSGFYFKINKNTLQITLESSKGLPGSPKQRLVPFNTGDSKSFIQSIDRELPEDELSKLLYAFLAETSATKHIDWENVKEKGFSPTRDGADEIIERLNLALIDLFGENLNLRFKMHTLNQARLFPDKTLPGDGLNLKSAIFSKKETSNLLYSIGTIGDLEAMGDRIIDLLAISVSTSHIDWYCHVDSKLQVEEEIVEKGKVILKEHYKDLKEFYFDEFRDKVNSIEDKDGFLDFWKNNVAKKFKVVKSLKTFTSYSKIKEDRKYPRVILSTSTASVNIGRKTSLESITISLNQSEIGIIKNTERTLNSMIEIYDSYNELDKYIKNKSVESLSILNTSKYVENSYIYNCKNAFLSTNTSSIDLNAKTVVLAGKGYSMHNLKECITAIDSYFENLVEKIKSEYTRKVDSLSNISSSDENYFVLNLVDDFDRKGITTYISILRGEDNSKIRSNDYDKSNSYGKLKLFPKTEIENIIRSLIRSGFINENRYKASFGSYYGLALSETGKACIKKIVSEQNSECNREKEASFVKQVESIDSFIKEFKKADSHELVYMLISTLKSNIKDISASDISAIVNFIKNERYCYRAYEDEIIELFSSIVPKKFKQIFLLNANMSSGVTQNTFNILYNR